MENASQGTGAKGVKMCSISSHNNGFPLFEWHSKLFFLTKKKSVAYRDKYEYSRH